MITLRAGQRVMVTVSDVGGPSVEALLSHYRVVGRVVSDVPTGAGIGVDFSEGLTLLARTNGAIYNRFQGFISEGEIHSLGGRLYNPTGRWVLPQYLVPIEDDISASASHVSPPAFVTVEVDGSFVVPPELSDALSQVSSVTFRNFLPARYKGFVTERTAKAYRLQQVVRRYADAGVPAQILSEALMQAITTAQAMTSGTTALNQVDELVRALELEAPSMVIGTHLFKLQKVGAVDGKKYAAHLRNMLKKRAEAIVAQFEQSAKKEAELIIHNAERRLAETERKIAQLVREGVRPPNWVAENGIPCKWDSDKRLYIGFYLRSDAFQTVQYKYQSITYIWNLAPHPGSPVRVLAWLVISGAGGYSQTSLMSDTLLPHIGGGGSCFELQDVPSMLSSIDDYERLSRAYNRSLAVINMNSLLVSNGLEKWPAWLLGRLPEEIKILLRRRTLLAEVPYRPHQMGNPEIPARSFYSHDSTVSEAAEVASMVTVAQAANEVARLRLAVDAGTPVPVEPGPIPTMTTPPPQPTEAEFAATLEEATAILRRR